MNNVATSDGQFENPELQPTLSLALEKAERFDVPFRHWRITNVLPEAMADRLRSLPLDWAPAQDNKGRRETLNEFRHFFSPELQAQFGECSQLAQLFQATDVVVQLEALTGRDLSRSFLRIELCRDLGVFWLEPHKDVKEKLLTIQIYLYRDSFGQNWGTDLYDPDVHWWGKVPNGFDRGFIFVPADDTVHGFEKVALAGSRHTLIVNYVDSSWRSRHELSFPDSPVS